MADPITLGTLAKFAGVGAGLSIIDRFINHVETRELRALQNQTLDQMTQFNNDLLRRARGKFTDAEIAQIKQNAEPAVNAVAGNVAARGLTGPAGAAIVGEAQQRPFLNAQNAAAQAVPGSLQNLMAIINQNLAMFQGDDSLAKEFGGLVQSYAMLKGLNTIPGDEGTATPGQGYEEFQPGNPHMQPGWDTQVIPEQFDIFNMDGSGGY